MGTLSVQCRNCSKIMTTTWDFCQDIKVASVSCKMCSKQIVLPKSSSSINRITEKIITTKQNLPKHICTNDSYYSVFWYNLYDGNFYDNYLHIDDIELPALVLNKKMDYNFVEGRLEFEESGLVTIFDLELFLNNSDNLSEEISTKRKKWYRLLKWYRWLYNILKKREY